MNADAVQHCDTERIGTAAELRQVQRFQNIGLVEEMVADPYRVEAEFFRVKDE
jgi:hypothetical protein